VTGERPGGGEGAPGPLSPEGRRAPVLILTHAEDYYNVDRVAAALLRRGARSLRIDTDRYPFDLGLTLTLREGRRPVATLETGSASVDLSRMGAIYCRRLWPGRAAQGQVEPRYAGYCAHASALTFLQTLAEVEGPFFLNPIAAGIAAESKPRQLAVAAEVGLRLPETLFTNDPRAVRALRDRAGTPLVTKLVSPLSESMDASGAFVYTSILRDEDYAALDALRAAPQIFQPLVAKRRELRVVVVGRRVFAGAIEVAPGLGPLSIDWRRPQPRPGASPWRRAALPPATEARVLALMDRLGIAFGALDFLEDDAAGEPIFLEVNPAGEWGFLERDLDLPISLAIADLLVERGSDRPGAAP